MALSDDIQKAIRRIPYRVGDVVIDWIDRNFSMEAYDGSPWPKKRFEDGRALLVKTGKLRRSIKIYGVAGRTVVVGSDRVENGSNLAEIHNEGKNMPKRQFMPMPSDTKLPKSLEDLIYKAMDDEMKKIFG